MTVQFDTGSSGVYLVTDKCQSTSCDNKNLKKYNTKESNYFLMEEADSSDRTELQYGKGFIAGRVATDRMCFSDKADNCMGNFQFLAVDQGTDLEADRFSGILGLSPTALGGKHLTGFMTQVKNSGSFPAIFSMYLTSGGAQGSAMTFGGYDTT